MSDWPVCPDIFTAKLNFLTDSRNRMGDLFCVWGGDKDVIDRIFESINITTSSLAMH